MYENNTLRMVVAGTPRGGTNYVRFALQDLGYEVSHEGIYNDETYHCPDRLEAELSNSCAEIEVSGFAAPFVKRANKEGIKIVQLIRNPVSVVNSILHRWPHAYGSFASGGGEAHEQVARWWMEQHNEICLYASGIIMLEKIETEFLFLLHELGGAFTHDHTKVIHVLCQDSKRRSFGNTVQKYSMSDLPSDVQEFASGFGYKD